MSVLLRGFDLLVLTISFSAAYSLSGHIQISLSSPTSFFDSRRSVAVLLQSLSVTFEGQTELVTEDTGYSAFRLCSITQELVDGEPIELNNEGHEDSASPCTWNVVFNITIPGWLPETCTFGDREGGTRYGLHASAIIQSIDDGASSSWLSTFCAPFHFPIRPVKASRVDIHLNRFAGPRITASSSSSLWPLSHYAVSPEIQHAIGEGSFPGDILSKLRVQVSIPERVGTEEGSLPLGIRLRTNGLSAAECKRMRVTDFDVDLEQCERYRYILFHVLDATVPNRFTGPCHFRHSRHSSLFLQERNNLHTGLCLTLILYRRCSTLGWLQSRRHTTFSPKRSLFSRSMRPVITTSPVMAMRFFGMPMRSTQTLGSPCRPPSRSLKT